MSDSICLQLQLGVVARQTLKNLLEEYRTLPTTLLSDTATAAAHQLTVTLRCCDGFSREAQAVVTANRPNWDPFLFTPLEEAIVRFVAQKPAKAQLVATHTGYADQAGEPTTKLRNVLVHLRERNILIVTESGYALTEAFSATAKILSPGLFAATP